MKAIFGVAAPARPLDRAASAGEAVSGCVERSTAGRHGDHDQRHQRRGSRVDATAAACALARLFDQCLDQGLELLAIDRIARTRRARRSGNGHGCLPDSVALVLLASC